MIKALFTFWTGDNPMSEARRKCLNSLTRSGLDVYLVTPETLKEYEVEPFHPAYEYLSKVHKSDYLRCYFMHHFGGAYADVKWCERDWTKAFDMLGISDHYALGYSEVGAFGVAECETPQVRQMLIDNYHKLIGVCAMICKAKTPFTTEWMQHVNAKLDSKFNDLKQNRGNVMGDNEGYPLRWTELLGDIFHPLAYKYHKHIIQNDSIKPNFRKAYR